MRRITLCLALLALVPLGLRADTKPPMPKAPPLSPGTAKVEGENLLCELTIVRRVPETRAVTVVKDGKAVTENRTVVVETYVMERRYFALKGLQAYVIGDKGTDPTKRLQSLDPTKLPQLLRNSNRVFFHWNADKPIADQVKELKEGIVILVVPSEKPAPRPPVAPEKK
jgi:hypothetical protein